MAQEIAQVWPTPSCISLLFFYARLAGHTSASAEVSSVGLQLRSANASAVGRKQAERSLNGTQDHLLDKLRAENDAIRAVSHTTMAVLVVIIAT